MRKLLLLIFLLSVVVLSGCDTNSLKNSVEDFKTTIKDKASSNLIHSGEQNYKHKRMPTLYEFFNSSNVKAYRRVDKNIINCTSGQCPKPDKAMEYFIDEKCFFCNRSSEVYDDKIIAHVGPLNWQDTTGLCTEKHTFSYPNEFIIVNKTRTRIIAKANGRGYAEKMGKSCTTQYKYKLITEETWIFTTEDLKGNIEVTQEGPLNAEAIIYGKNQRINYSKNGLIVKCEVEGFRVKPWVELLQYNQYNATKNQNLLKIHKETREYYKNPERFTFSSLYNGTFIIRPICKIVGKNSNTIEVIKSNKTYKLIVRGAKEVLNEDWVKKNLIKI